MDTLVQNEAIAGNRVIAPRVLLVSGAGLPLAHVWIAGTVKLSKNGADFVNTTNLPVAVLGGQDGSFNLALTAAELDTAGPLRVQLLPAGSQLTELVFMVRASAAVDANAVVAAIFSSVQDPNAPANARTYQEQWNLLCSESFGNGEGIDGPIGTIKALAGVVSRLAFTVISGKRTFTSRDGRP